MRCAQRVNENTQTRILLNQRSRSASVIEMNVREQNRVQVGNAEAVTRQLFAERAKGGGGARVHQRVASLRSQQSRSDRARVAGPNEVERNSRLHEEEDCSVIKREKAPENAPKSSPKGVPRLGRAEPYEVLAE